MPEKVTAFSFQPAARVAFDVLPYSGPKPTLEHSRILLDARHRLPSPVMFLKENNTQEANP